MNVKGLCDQPGVPRAKMDGNKSKTPREQRRVRRVTIRIPTVIIPTFIIPTVGIMNVVCRYFEIAP